MLVLKNLKSSKVSEGVNIEKYSFTSLELNLIYINTTTDVHQITLVIGSVYI